MIPVNAGYLLGGLLVSALAAGSLLQETDELIYVSDQRLSLLSLPQEEGVPVLGQLFEGTPLIVREVRGDYVRVSLQAWVRREGLAGTFVDSDSAEVGADEAGGDLTEASAEARPQRTPKPSDLPPVTDLGLTHQVYLQPRWQPATDEQEAGLVVECWLATVDLRTVHFEGKRTLLVSVFEEGRIAGGKYRGDRLVQQRVELAGKKARWFVPAELLGRRKPGMKIRLTARTELEQGWTVYGSLGDLEPEPADEK
jgi:hypothetical protein